MPALPAMACVAQVGKRRRELLGMREHARWAKGSATNSTAPLSRLRNRGRPDLTVLHCYTVVASTH
eukprot:10321454-Alexandrium_andersonii.AAC.1